MNDEKCEDVENRIYGDNVDKNIDFVFREVKDRNGILGKVVNRNVYFDPRIRLFDVYFSWISISNSNISYIFFNEWF